MPQNPDQNSSHLNPETHDTSTYYNLDGGISTSPQELHDQQTAENFLEATLSLMFHGFNE